MTPALGKLVAEKQCQHEVLDPVGWYKDSVICRRCGLEIAGLEVQRLRAVFEKVAK